jgi:DNA polymerase
MNLGDLEAMFGDVDVQVTFERHGHDRALLARARGLVRRHTLACTACPAHALCHGPTPAELPSRPRFLVIGEAPGPEESLRGRPFIGRSGKLLRAMFDRAQINPTYDVGYANVVSCFPNDDGKIRQPTEREIRACSKNLWEQIEAAGVDYLLLVGAHALAQFRTDLKVSEVGGKVFVWKKRFFVMPILHPAYILRNMGVKKMVNRQLAYWREVVWSDQGLKALGIACVRCGASAHAYDPDGVPLCKYHEKRGMETWRKQQPGFVKTRKKSRQEGTELL